MIAALLVLLVPPELPAFEADPAVFADAAACHARLAALAEAARGEGYEAVEGPYDIAPGDVRIHAVRAEGNGHLIVEHRCAGARLSERSWTRSMEPEEEPFTIESVARRAPWLQKALSE